MDDRTTQSVEDLRSHAVRPGSPQAERGNETAEGELVAAPAEAVAGGSFWSLFVLLLAAAAVLVALQARRPKPSGAYVGLPLPPLESGGWLNTTAPLSAKDLRGKIVLVDFWASDCGPCIEHVPDLIRFYQRFHDQGVQIVGLTTESGFRFQHLKNFVETRDGLDWPIGYDAELAYEMMGISGTPTYLLYDRAGRSVWGGHSLYGLEDAVVAALAEK